MSPQPPSFFRSTTEGVEVFVRLTPKSSRDAVEGIGETADGRCHLKARVRAVPEDGKANKALEKLVARWLGVPVGNVSVVGGATSRLKTVAAAGNPETLASRCRQVSDA
ncbi:DUF167 family protein [Chelativorans salis]|uniref:UPF0235 protein N5A92_15955 n=1 Tax=Chelativorans salis TaxID=2978478 RepID=A0ABT2LR19_9HYPH|nr:DUF167 family protein [Chelativorans sp. EGI FJ00035]MCT7376529.1 DUF167 family protein [Chelativorans sp. EGI FJ00035]